MKTVLVYPGSFDPFHIGHLHVILKGEHIFGHGNVIVARGFNPEKCKTKGVTQDQIDEWCSTLSTKINCDVYSYDGFLHDFLNRLEQENPNTNFILLRGLRNATDLAYEENQLKFIKEFKPDVKVIYIMCDPQFNHISSSAIRNLNQIKHGSGDQYIV